MSVYLLAIVMSDPISSLTLADFQPLAGDVFTVRTEGEAMAVTLTAVRSLGRHTPGGRESFELLFHAPPSCKIRQGTFAVSHHRLGEHAIFLVALGPDARGMRLEAIFNFL